MTLTYDPEPEVPANPLLGVATRFADVFSFPDNPRFLDFKPVTEWNLHHCQSVKYTPELSTFLPKPDNKPETLRFIGLNEHTIREVLEKYEEKYGFDSGKVEDSESPSTVMVAYKEITIPKVYEFPIANALLGIYKEIVRIKYPLPVPKRADNSDFSWGEYYQRALRLGLLDRHAAKVGVHRRDISYPVKGAWIRYFGSVGACIMRVEEWMGRLQLLWMSQITDEKEKAEAK